MGQASIADLAKKSGVKRTSIYHFIENLKERRLLFETSRKKRKVYSAAKPHQLVELGRIRLAEIQGLMPELMAIYNSSEEKPRVTFYEGVDGIREVYADTIQEGKPIIGWSDFEALRGVLGEFYKEYPIERAKRNIELRQIVRDSSEARAAMKRDPRFLRETKFMSAAELRCDIMVYGNKVAMMSLMSKPPFAVLVEDGNLAQTHRLVWEELWKRR